MTRDDKLILVGVITAAKGIKGEVIIKSFTQQPTNIATLNLVNDQRVSIKLKIIRTTNKGELICSVNDIKTRSEIEKLRRVKLFCLAIDLPALEADEFYVNDLKNKQLIDKSRKSIGFVRNVVNYGAGDLLELQFNNGQVELFIFNAKNFPQVEDDYLMFIPPVIIK